MAAALPVLPSPFSNTRAGKGPSGSCDAGCQCSPIHLKVSRNPRTPELSPMIAGCTYIDLQIATNITVMGAASWRKRGASTGMLPMPKCEMFEPYSSFSTHSCRTLACTTASTAFRITLARKPVLSVLTETPIRRHAHRHKAPALHSRRLCEGQAPGSSMGQGTSSQTCAQSPYLESPVLSRHRSPLTSMR